ncbi:MAG: hypothetical protein FWH15_07910 [Betaproteobacteria bacterium]|nr:hypothetical protein [Betaproteobacteria bacterium]
MNTVPVAIVAKMLDLDDRRVQQLAKEGIIPKPRNRGEYNLLACTVAYIKYLRSRIDGGSGDYITEKTKLTRTQTEKAQIEIDRLRGVLVTVAAAERGWSALVGAFRAKMLTVPYRAALESAGKSEKEIEQILTDMIYEALAELSNWKPDEEDADIDGNIDTGSEDSGSASEDDA